MVQKSLMGITVLAMVLSLVACTSSSDEGTSPPWDYLQPSGVPLPDRGFASLGRAFAKYRNSSPSRTASVRAARSRCRSPPSVSHTFCRTGSNTWSPRRRYVAKDTEMCWSFSSTVPLGRYSSTTGRPPKPTEPCGHETIIFPCLEMISSWLSSRLGAKETIPWPDFVTFGVASMPTRRTTKTLRLT